MLAHCKRAPLMHLSFPFVVSIPFLQKGAENWCSSFVTYYKGRIH